MVSSQAWVAFNFALLCWFIQIINDWNRSDILWISFFATLFAYNLAHWEFKKTENYRVLVMLISLGITLVLAFQYLNIISLVVLGILAVISFLYAIPGKYNIRKIPRSKIFWIGMVWSISVILPWFEDFSIPVWRIILQIIAVFCFVTAITIPFDIRDIEQDDQNFATIPQLLGIDRSRRLSTQLLMVSGGLFLIILNFEINDLVLAVLVTLLISIWLVRKVNLMRQPWFTSFWIEGLSGLFWLIYMVLL